MSQYFSYNLSYFRSGESSSIDLFVNTNGDQTNGFQLVVDIFGKNLNIIDQNQELSDIQIAVPTITNINFIANKVIKRTADHYTLSLSGLTSNPKKGFITSEPTLVGKIIFSQSKEDKISFLIDTKRSKMSFKDGLSRDLFSQQEIGGVSKKQPTQTVIETVSTGKRLKKLTGRTFVLNNTVRSKATNDKNASSNQDLKPKMQSQIRPETVTKFMPNFDKFRLSDFLFGVLFGVIYTLLILVIIRRFRNRSPKF